MCQALVEADLTDILSDDMGQVVVRVEVVAGEVRDALEQALDKVRSVLAAAGLATGLVADSVPEP